MKLLILAGALLAAGPSFASKQRASKQAGPEVVIQAGRSDSDNIAFSGDGRLLVIGGGPVRLYEADSGLLVREFPFGTQAGSATNLALSADGATLVWGDGDSVKAWSTETGKLLRTYKVGAGSIAFMPDGQVAVGLDNGLAVLDLRSGKVQKPRGAPSLPLALVGVDGAGRIWFKEEDNLLQSFDPKIGERVSVPDSNYQEIAFNRDGKFLVTFRYDAETLQLRDGATGAVVRELPIPLGKVYGLGFSDDGTRLVAVVAPKVTTLGTYSNPDVFYYWFSVASGGLLSRIEPPRTAVTLRNALAPGGRVHLANSVDVMRFFDTSTGQQIRNEQGNILLMGGVSFSSDGNRLLTTNGKYGADRIQLWDLASGRITRTFEGMRGLFGPDGKTAVLVGLGSASYLTSLGTVTVYDAATFEKLNDLPVENAFSVAYAPDGKRVAVDNKEGVRIFEVESAEQVGEPLAGLFAGFSPDGRRLARYLQNGEVHVHDAATFKEVASCPEIEGHEFDYSRFGPGGRLALYGKEIVGSAVTARSALVVLDTGPKGCKVLFKRYNAGAPWFSPDGRRLFFTDSEVRTLALDFATGRTGVLTAFSDVALGEMVWRPGRPSQVASSNTAMAVLFDLKADRLLARLTPFGEEYVTSLADGRYLASRGALRSVAFRVGNRGFPFEQFDLRFNRPDAVLEALGAASPASIAVARAAVKKRLKRAGFTEQQLSGELQLPEVFVAATPPPSTKERTPEMTISARDAGANLDRLLVAVNDVPIGGSAGLPLRERKARAVEQKVAVPLSLGKNRLRVSVLNARGVESLPRTFEILLDQPPKKPDLYLVAIGVSQYQDAQWSLRYAAKDASDVAAFFEKKRDRFSEVKVLRLLDGDATKVKIAAAREFFKPSTVDDLAVVFFAGHGLRDKKLDYYFATADIDFADPAARGMPYDDIDGLLDGIGARRKLLLVDTCNSGELDKDEARLIEAREVKAAGGVISSRGIKMVVNTAPLALGMKGAAELLEEVFADVRRGSGAVAIASAGGAEFALESSEWKNGVFTYALLSTLAEGKSRVSELREAVSAKVLKLTDGKQRPTVRRENLNFDFDVY